MLARLFITAIFSQMAIFATTLTPNAPVPFSFANSVVSFVTVAGNSSGYMAVRQCQDNSVIWCFSSDNGSTWTSPTPLGVSSFTAVGPWIAANETGFVVVWSDISPGSPPGKLFSTFTSDQGATWSTIAVIDNVANVNGSPTVVGTSSGFLVTWWQPDNTIHSSFSADGTNWGSAVLIDLDNVHYPEAQPIVTGFGDSFLVTWPTFSGFGYSSFSSNRGATWSSKSLAATGIADGQIIWPARTTDGYMAVWQDGAGSAFSTFSSDNGTTWGTQHLITTGINTYYEPISIVGTDLGFIVTAHFSDNTGQVSLSNDFGVTWNSFVTFTGSYLINNSIYDGFADIALGLDGCMLTWPDTNNNAISVFIPLSFSPSSLSPVSNLQGQCLFNQFPFQSQYYTSISWQASPSQDVAGYNIYKNGTLLTSTSELSLIDQLVNKHSIYTYEVVAYNSSGTTSSGVSITIETP